jgi:hypothetical protein
VNAGLARRRVMDEIRETLTFCADDAVLEIASCDSSGLVMRVSLPSRGGELWEIRSATPVHIDLNPRIALGEVHFGGLDLLPPAYLADRNFDYGAEESEYRVLKIVDVDGKVHHVVCYGKEQIIPMGAG